MTFDSWVEQLGRDLGRPELSIAGGAVPYLALESGLEIAFEADPATGALFLHSVLPRPFLGPAEEGPYLELLLIANHVDEHALGAVLAIDPLTEDTLIWRAIEPGEVPDYAGFARLVGAFAQRASEMAHSPGSDRESSTPIKLDEVDPLYMLSNFIRV